MIDGMTIEDINNGRRDGQDFSNTDLSHLNARLVDLTGTKAVGLILRGSSKPATLDNAANSVDKFAEGMGRTKLSQARFNGADLTDADLTWAALVGAQMFGAVLRNAKLVEADLRRANLRQADVRGADFTGAAMEDADLRGARWDDTTKWPDSKYAPWA